MLCVVVCGKGNGEHMHTYTYRKVQVPKKSGETTAIIIINQRRRKGAQETGDWKQKGRGTQKAMYLSLVVSDFISFAFLWYRSSQFTLVLAQYIHTMLKHTQTHKICNSIYIHVHTYTQTQPLPPRKGPSIHIHSLTHSNTHTNTHTKTPTSPLSDARALQA